MKNEIYNIDKNDSKFYYPSCREASCNGVLKIKINDNFTLDYECDENINHKGNKIYFKNFENNFLIEKSFEKCIICNKLLDKKFKFKCNICNNIYCPDTCFLYDEHIKKSLSNLSIINNKCPTHKEQFSYYCINCKKYLCKYCMKDDTLYDIHNKKGHDIINLVKLIPSKKEIADFINKIKNISKKYETLINSIEQWQKQLIKTSEKLKRGLKSQIELFEKIILNYNQYFHNYAYYSNFHHIKEFFYKFYNENKDLFNSCYQFEKQTKIIIDFFNKMKKNKPPKYEIKYYPVEENGVITKLNDNYFVEYSCDADKIYLHNYYLKKTVGEIHFKESIFSFFNSIKNKQIYACLADGKRINFIDYNLEEGWIKLSKNEIEDNVDTDDNYNKCIDISDDYLAACDDVGICVWGKYIKKEKKEQKIEFKIINRIKLNTKTSDLLFINNEYFISAQPDNNSITFININSIEIDKIIPKIDCTDSVDCLSLFKNQIIIKCSKGIAILYVNTKELIQYIRLSPNCMIKKLCYDDNSIFILNKYKYKSRMIIIEYKMVDNCLVPYLKYPNLTLYEDNVDIFVMNKKYLILFYIGEKKSNNEDVVIIEKPYSPKHENKHIDEDNDEEEEEDDENIKIIKEEDVKENTEEENDSNIEEYKLYKE